MSSAKRKRSERRNQQAHDTRAQDHSKSSFRRNHDSREEYVAINYVMCVETKRELGRKSIARPGIWKRLLQNERNKIEKI
jgi:hypothetical protein